MSTSARGSRIVLLSVAYRVCGWGWNRFCTPGYPLAATVGPLSRFEDWQPRSKKLFHPRCCTALWISTPSGYFLRPAMLPSLSLSLDRTGQLSPSLSLSLSLSIYLSIYLSPLSSSRHNFRPRESACTRGVGCLGNWPVTFIIREGVLFPRFFFIFL